MVWNDRNFFLYKHHDTFTITLMLKRKPLTFYVNVFVFRLTLTCSVFSLRRAPNRNIIFSSIINSIITLRNLYFSYSILLFWTEKNSRFQFSTSNYEKKIVTLNLFHARLRKLFSSAIIKNECVNLILSDFSKQMHKKIYFSLFYFT